MTRRLNKLEKRLETAEYDNITAIYESFISDIPEFNGYLSSSKTGRFCYTEDVPSSTIEQFCSSFDPIESYRLMQQVEAERITLQNVSDKNNSIDVEDHLARAEDTVRRANLFIANSKALRCKHGPSFADCPVVWDTGASYGLTPFRADFIHYEEVEITVEDITKKNTVIGICTVMWKFATKSGRTAYLPISLP